MVAVVLIHMVQVFLFGAYKFPRELTWIIGVFLLLMTLGMAFSGQVLRFDQDAYWGLGIGASIASRVPILGPATVKLMLGGPIIAGATLSRFFALHVFVIPGLLIGFVCLHLLMVLKLGINEWPMPGRLVKRATYEAEYHELTKTDGAPFVPYGVWKDMFFAAFILLAVAACAVYFGPFGPSGQPDPTIIQTAPRPDYFFLWLYALLSLLPPAMETPALLVGPVLVIIGLLLLPFLSGEGGKSWRRRPIAVLTVMLIAVTLGTFTHLAGFAPWSPHMNAWSGDPIPDRFLHGSTALQRQGALVFQSKQCRNCHSLGELGGQRGPTLDSVAVRLTQDQLIRQVIQGGGNMPAYGKNLSPAETTALVAFLETLHPAGQAIARDASRDAVLKEGPSYVQPSASGAASLVAADSLDRWPCRNRLSVSPWMDSSAFRLAANLARMARRQLFAWSIFRLAGPWFAVRRFRRAIANGSYVSAPFAHDLRPAAHLAGCAADAPAARPAAAVRANDSRPAFSLATLAEFRRLPRAPGCLLAPGRRRSGRLACSLGVHAGSSIGTMARRRTLLFPCHRPSFLVARCATLAQRRTRATMVHPSLSFPRHAAVRHPLRIFGFLRPRCLPDLSFGAKTLRNFRARRSAMRSRPHVDLCHDHLPERRRDSHASIARLSPNPFHRSPCVEVCHRCASA